MLNKLKKFSLFIILGSILLVYNSTIICLQTDDEYIYDFELWLNEGDTIKTKAFYINQFNLQFCVTTVDTAGNEKETFTPKDLKGFKYNNQASEVEFHSMENPNDMGRLFLRIVYKGEYSLYQFLEINLHSTVLSFTALYYLWNNGWLRPPISKTFEKESLLEHFSDCPELEYKIKKGQYGYSNLNEIMSEYENCELTDEYEFILE
ncbi:MAG: hypothetical protein JW894_05160 [Bacteroidales bacterium]|nr:hypothetical protein [Bacteroidales bacterium]